MKKEPCSRAARLPRIHGHPQPDFLEDTEAIRPGEGRDCSDPPGWNRPKLSVFKTLRDPMKKETASCFAVMSSFAGLYSWRLRRSRCPTTFLRRSLTPFWEGGAPVTVAVYQFPGRPADVFTWAAGWPGRKADFPNPTGNGRAGDRDRGRRLEGRLQSGQESRLNPDKENFRRSPGPCPWRKVRPCGGGQSGTPQRTPDARLRLQVSRGCPGSEAG
jgi:hypothetical protein